MASSSSQRNWLPWRDSGVTLGRAFTARALAALAVAIVIGTVLAWLPLQLAGAAVVGSIAIFLILLHPTLGLLLLVPTIPFSPLISLRVGGVTLGGMEALLALTLAAWLLRMAVRRQVVIPHPPLLVPWLIWLGVILLSWTQALSLGSAFTETAKWLEMLALYLFVVANVERRHVPWVLAAFLIAGAAQAALGLYQFAWRVGPEGFLIFDGRFMRAYGTFGQPNPYAGYLGLSLPLAYSLALWGVGRIANCGWRNGDSQSATRNSQFPIGLLTGLAIAASLLMVAAVYASQSRGAWIGVAGSIVVVSVVRSKRAVVLFGGLAVTLAIVGALGTAQLLPASVIQRFSDVLPAAQIPDIATAEVTDANFPVIERLAHWQSALDMWRDHPWLGVGLGNYPATYPAYAIGRWRDPLGHAHNIYLNAGAETGLAGLITYVGFWLAAFWLAWRALRRSEGMLRAVAVGGLGVLVHLTLHNTVDNLFVQGMYLHMSIVLGMLSVVCSAGVPETTPLGLTSLQGGVEKRQ